jgi:putative ABC transport system ATP-binding protein
LAGVSLGIGKGEFIALAGPSGSGKTTLLTLAGTLDRPTAGRVCLLGDDLGVLNKRELAHLRNERIGFVFQSFNLLPALTVEENVELPLRLSGEWKGRKLGRPGIQALLAAVGLEGYGGRFPRELSGGQRQRVAVARALSASPELVLADEPTANLDSSTGAALVALMRAMNRERGVTFVFSTHDPAVMAEAGRVIRLRDGLVVNGGAS